MIWHLLEIWLLLLVAFVIGCLLGSLLHDGLAKSPLADAQGAVADAIGDTIDALEVRLGTAPAWRPEHRRPVEPLDRKFYTPAFEFPAAEAYADAAGTSAEVDELDRQRPEPGMADWYDGLDRLDEEPPAAEPVGAAPVPPPPESGLEPDLPAMRPAGLAAPRNGVPDDLQRIRGIGQRNEELLNGLGIFHFSQIAAWTPAEVRWVSAFLAFPERIERDDWIRQATILGSGGDTGYVKADRRRAHREREEEEALPEE